MRWYMLTLVGRDRPGIVAGLADTLARAGATFGEASMARLGGNFTVMLMVSIEADLARLAATVEPFARRMGLRAHVDAIEGSLQPPASPNVRVTVQQAGQPSVVAQVAAALAGAGFNILGIGTAVAGSAGELNFAMVIDGHVSGGMAALESALAAARADGVDVGIADLETRTT